MNLLELLRDADRKLDNGEITIGEYEKMIVPLKDAVPVVRCKDCMHYGFTDNRIPEEQVWWCYFWDDVKSPDAYCSDGERNDSEHETD